MPAFSEPYWLRVIRFFERKGFIQNGLTIPFLFGSRHYIQPDDAHYTIERLSFEFYHSKTPLTILFCNNINEFVVGTMDLETVKMIADGKVSYNPIGQLYCVDSSLAKGDIDWLTKFLVDRYSNLIDNEKYSLVDGIWQSFSQFDEDRLQELFWEEKAASEKYSS